MTRDQQQRVSPSLIVLAVYTILSVLLLVYVIPFIFIGVGADPDNHTLLRPSVMDLTESKPPAIASLAEWCAWRKSARGVVACVISLLVLLASGLQRRSTALVVIHGALWLSLFYLAFNVLAVMAILA